MSNSTNTGRLVLREHMPSFLLGIYLGVQLGHMLTLCFTIWGTSTLSQRGHTGLYAQQHHTRAPFSPHPGQHLPLSTFFLEVLLEGITWYRALDFAFPQCLRASLHVEMKCLSHVCEAGLDWGSQNNTCRMSGPLFATAPQEGCFAKMKLYFHCSSPSPCL